MQVVVACVRAVLIVASIAMSTAVQAADAPVPGHVVLAKPDGDAILIWDATPVVVSIVTNNLSNAAADAQLEHDAIHILATYQKLLDPDAKTVTLRVTYQKVGAVNPAYGAQTFAGVERYALVTVPAAHLKTDADHWMELADNATAPAWVKFTVTGQLPPRKQG